MGLYSSIYSLSGYPIATEASNILSYSLAPTPGLMARIFILPKCSTASIHMMMSLHMVEECRAVMTPKRTSITDIRVVAHIHVLLERALVAERIRAEPT